MASVNIQGRVAASADQVWPLLADFGGLHRLLDPGRVKSTEADGNHVGAERRIVLASDAVIVERLEAIDPRARRLSYSIIGASPLPVTEYVATVKVTDLEEGCQIDWQSTFRPVGKAADAEAVIAALYSEGISKIRYLLESPNE